MRPSDESHNFLREVTRNPTVYFTVAEVKHHDQVSPEGEGVWFLLRVPGKLESITAGKGIAWAQE